MLKRILILLTVALAFLGCKDGALHIKILYDQIQGLKKSDRVIFEQNQIGKVTGIFYSADGYYAVDLIITEAFANAATEHSRFIIIADPQNKGKRAIEMVQIQTGGSPLQDGATVQGSNSSSAALSQMRENFEKELADLEEQFQQLLEDLRRLPENEDLKNLKKELERLTEELKLSGKSVREKIQKDLLPRLKQEIERLREELRRFGREEELEPLETQIQEIMEI